MFIIVVRDLVTRDEFDNPEVYTTYEDAEEDMISLRALWENTTFYPDRVEPR